MPPSEDKRPVGYPRSPSQDRECRALGAPWPPCPAWCLPAGREVIVAWEARARRAAAAAGAGLAAGPLGAAGNEVLCNPRFLSGLSI